MKIRSLALILTSVLHVESAPAAPRTVTLDVQNMTCAVCPLTIKKALQLVSGVQQVRVDYANKTATVQFDDSRTNAENLTEATKSAGFPATVRSAQP